MQYLFIEKMKNAEIDCNIKQYSFHTECPVVKSVKKEEVTVHFTRKGTFHRGHRLHTVLSHSLSRVVVPATLQKILSMTTQNFGKHQI